MLKTFAAGALVAVSPALADTCTPIQFAPGTSSATVKGMAKGDDDQGVCYTLKTAAGQTATVRLLLGPKSDVAFTIGDVVDNRDNYTFKTAARAYTIGVGHTFPHGRDEPFTLQVSVK